jgi:hypothetical protein
MICSHCGGSVEWQGPLSMLTHTKCLSCGAVNAQVVAPESECRCSFCGRTLTEDDQCGCEMGKGESEHKVPEKSLDTPSAGG